MALAAGVLMLPVALMITAFGPWSERKVAAEAVAAEAARAVVLDLSHDSGAAVVSSTAAALGLSPEEVRVGWCGAAPAVTPTGICPLGRGGIVTITVQLWTPLVSTPWGPVGGLWVTADHSEPIDLYRSLG